MTTRKLLHTLAALLAAPTLALAGGGSPAFDVQINMGDIGTSAFFVSSFTPNTEGVVATTGSGNPNPTITLEIGKRYKIVQSNNIHPFSIQNGGTFNMVLAQTSGAVGSFEGDASVDWSDTGFGGSMIFTLSQALVDALTDSAGTGIYQCLNHGGMTGPIAFKAAGTNLVWPSGSENFERSVLDEDVVDAFANWTIVTPSASYTAKLNAPPADPGVDATSNRALVVTDTDTAGSNRVYPPEISPSSGNVDTYFFEAKVDVQSIAAGTTALFIAQHHTGASFANVGGLEFTDSGVNLIILGTDDSGIGKAGPSTRQALYSYTDTTLGQDNWVTLKFEIDFETNSVNGTATGSNGSTTFTNSLSGIALQGATPNPNRFRACLRNNAVGSQSTIAYDNLSFAGVLAPPAAVENWNMY